MLPFFTSQGGINRHTRLPGKVQTDLHEKQENFMEDKLPRNKLVFRVTKLKTIVPVKCG